jgi:hypothetical protein
VERARHEAARAERAFHQCEPENRLVARSLEHRWEEKLGAVADVEAALATAHVDTTPLPPRAELEALASDLPRLWAASTTSNKDRKRLLRTLVADVTLMSEPAGATIRVGIRWRSGAAEELIVQRPARVWVARRTPPGAIALVSARSERRDDELVGELEAAGFRTGTGRPFDVPAVRWLRYAHRIPAPPGAWLAPGAVTVADVARKLGIAEDAVYYWISRGQLDAHRDRRGRLGVPFPADVEAACRQRVQDSAHLKPRTQTLAVGGAV